MSDHPTCAQYRLAVQIGGAVTEAMGGGMTYAEAISTLRHSISATQMNAASNTNRPATTGWPNPTNSPLKTRNRP